MIWLWLFRILYGIHRLFVVPDPKSLRRIDPNAKCPVCGAKTGAIRLRKIYRRESPDGKYMVVHTCAICACGWGEPPLSIPAHPVDFEMIES